MKLDYDKILARCNFRELVARRWTAVTALEIDKLLRAFVDEFNAQIDEALYSIDATALERLGMLIAEHALGKKTIPRRSRPIVKCTECGGELTDDELARETATGEAAHRCADTSGRPDALVLLRQPEAYVDSVQYEGTLTRTGQVMKSCRVRMFANTSIQRVARNDAPDGLDGERARFDIARNSSGRYIVLTVWFADDATQERYERVLGMRSPDVQLFPFGAAERLAQRELERARLFSQQPPAWRDGQTNERGDSEYRVTLRRREQLAVGVRQPQVVLHPGVRLASRGVRDCGYGVYQITLTADERRGAYAFVVTAFGEPDVTPATVLLEDQLLMY